MDDTLQPSWQVRKPWWRKLLSPWVVVLLIMVPVTYVFFFKPPPGYSAAQNGVRAKLHVVHAEVLEGRPIEMQIFFHFGRGSTRYHLRTGRDHVLELTVKDSSGNTIAPTNDSSEGQPEWVSIIGCGKLCREVNCEIWPLRDHRLVLLEVW